jgi:hypothetical protein
MTAYDSLLSDWTTTFFSSSLISPAFCFLLWLTTWLGLESELLYHWRFTTNQSFLVTNPLRLMTSNFIFQLKACGYGPYITSSHRLQLLLVLTSAVILRPESSGTHDHILLSQIWDSPNLVGQVPIFISPRNMMVQLYPKALHSLFVTSYGS